MSSDNYPRGFARSIFLSQWAYWCTLAMAAWSGLYLPAAGIVAFCTLTYFFLELLGFPRLSMLAVNLLGWGVFNLGMLYVIIRSR